MSWQAYVDTSLVGSGHIDKAAIYSAAGDSKWAASPGFEPSASELKDVVSSFTDTSEPKTIQGKGFHIAGEKFVVIKAEDRSLYGMKGKTGIIVVKTTQAVLIAHYPEGVQAQAAANTVETLGDYLIGLGY